MYERTRNNIRNATVSLLTQILLLVTGFFTRKVFIECLGAEVLGLNTTATSILNALNLLESGVWGAVAVTLYKPLYDGDRQRIKELLAFQAWLYRIIAVMVAVGSFVVMLFFPSIFGKTDLPAWYPYGTFLVLVYSSALRFLVNYRRVLIYADQKDYKVLLVSRILSFFKLVLQAVCVIRFKDGFLWWLILEVVCTTLTTILVNNIILRDYPYLREKVDRPSELRFKFPDVIGRMKMIACQNLGSFALNQLSPMLIYAYSSLTGVALYGNYTLITVNLSAIIGALESGMTAGIGNMIAEGDKRLIMKVYREFLSSKTVIVSICSVCMWLLMDPFITLWLGSGYQLGHTTLLLVIISFAVPCISNVFNAFLFSYGLFRDIWVPFFQCAAVVGAGIVLGQKYGMNGVLLGAAVPMVLTGIIWKSYYLFRSGFHLTYISFLVHFAKLVAVTAASASISILAVSAFPPLEEDITIVSFLLYALIVVFITFVTHSLLMYVFEKGFRDVIVRLANTRNARHNQ